MTHARTHTRTPLSYPHTHTPPQDDGDSDWEDVEEGEEKTAEDAADTSSEEEESESSSDDEGADKRQRLVEEGEEDANDYVDPPSDYEDEALDHLAEVCMFAGMNARYATRCCVLFVFFEREREVERVSTHTHTQPGRGGRRTGAHRA